jgi:hypothetical protein
MSGTPGPEERPDLWDDYDNRPVPPEPLSPKARAQLEDLFGPRKPEGEPRTKPRSSR